MITFNQIASVLIIFLCQHIGIHADIHVDINHIIADLIFKLLVMVVTEIIS
jgi:hypothetical protein